MRALVWAPALFALAFVLTVYADSGSAIEALPRPLLIAGGLAVAIQAALTLLCRDRAAGTVTALVVLIGMALPLLAITLSLCLVATMAFARWRGFSAKRLVVGAGPLVAILFAISAGRVVATPQVGGLHHRYDRAA